MRTEKNADGTKVVVREPDDHRARFMTLESEIDWPARMAEAIYQGSVKRRLDPLGEAEQDRIIRSLPINTTIHQPDVQKTGTSLDEEYERYFSKKPGHSVTLSKDFEGWFVRLDGKLVSDGGGIQEMRQVYDLLAGMVRSKEKEDALHVRPTVDKLEQGPVGILAYCSDKSVWLLREVGGWTQLPPITNQAEVDKARANAEAFLEKMK